MAIYEKVSVSKAFLKGTFQVRCVHLKSLSRLLKWRNPHIAIIPILLIIFLNYTFQH